MRYPTIRQDLAFIPFEEGVLIEGIPQPQVIRGAVAQTILPTLIGLADGSRSIEEIRAHFPEIPEDILNQTLSRLQEWDLLNSTGDWSNIDTTSNTISFLRRSHYGVDVGSNLEERLGKASVCLIVGHGFSKGGEMLRSLLLTMGLRSIHLVDCNHFTESSIPEQGSCVFLNCIERVSTPTHYTWMHAAAFPERNVFQIGPVFRPNSTDCKHCFTATYSQSHFRVQRNPELANHEIAWISLVATEILAFLVVPEIAISGRNFRRFNPTDWGSDLIFYPRITGCSFCKNPAFRTDAAKDSDACYFTDIAIAYEDVVTMENRKTSPHRLHENNNALIGRELREPKQFLNAARISLPNTSVLIDKSVSALLQSSPTAVNGGGPISLQDLSVLLAMTAGIKEISGDTNRRWSATAGNLGSVELYVVAHRINGLPEGLYFYQQLDHSLAQLCFRHRLKSGELISRSLGLTATEVPDALIILVGSLERLCEKYGPFGYRLLNFDAGVAASQFHLTARSLNIWSRTASRWADDLLKNQLNLLDSREQVTATIKLGRKSANRSFVHLWRKHRVSNGHKLHSWIDARCLQGVRPSELQQSLIRQSRLSEIDVKQMPQKIPRNLLTSQRAYVSRVPLPSPKARESTFGEVLSSRKSSREFSDAPVSRSVLLPMLRNSYRADAREWRSEYSAGLALEFLVLARRVDGLERGVYLYRDKGGMLNRLDREIQLHELGDALVQSVFVEAPVLVWVTGSLAGACASEGAFGHRKLLLRGGAACHRLWMTAIGLQLAGSLCAGLVPRQLYRFGIDGYRRATLMGCVIGHPKR